jgi:hypothetical protein
MNIPKMPLYINWANKTYFKTEFKNRKKIVSPSTDKKLADAEFKKMTINFILKTKLVTYLPTSQYATVVDGFISNYDDISMFKLYPMDIKDFSTIIFLPEFIEYYKKLSFRHNKMELYLFFKDGQNVHYMTLSKILELNELKTSNFHIDKNKLTTITVDSKANPETFKSNAELFAMKYNNNKSFERKITKPDSSYYETVQYSKGEYSENICVDYILNNSFNSDVFRPYPNGSHDFDLIHFEKFDENGNEDEHFTISEIKSQGRLNNINGTGIKISSILHYNKVQNKLNIKINIYNVDEHNSVSAILKASLNELFQLVEYSGHSFPDEKNSAACEMIVYPYESFELVMRLTDEQVSELQKMSEERYFDYGYWDNADTMVFYKYKNGIDYEKLETRSSRSINSPEHIKWVAEKKEHDKQIMIQAYNK